MSGYGFGDDEVPDTYYAQVHHYMAVLCLPWFVLSVYILEKDEARHYPIFRNEEFIKDLLAQEKDFWENYFEKSVIPSPAGLDNEEDMITGMFHGSETLVLDEAQHHLCAEYVEMNKTIKRWKRKNRPSRST
jgi:predicted phage-related endonuclease